MTTYEYRIVRVDETLMNANGAKGFHVVAQWLERGEAWVLMQRASLPPAAQDVLDEVVSEIHINLEASDVHSVEDIAADVAQRLYHSFRVAAADDGEPGTLFTEQRPWYEVETDRLIADLEGEAENNLRGYSNKSRILREGVDLVRRLDVAIRAETDPDERERLEDAKYRVGGEIFGVADMRKKMEEQNATETT